MARCKASGVLILTVTLVIMVALVSAFPVMAQSESFPEKPIRYVLHVTPGGATDVLARHLGQVLPDILGQPVYIENRPGGGGAAQLAILTNSPADGYTIGSVTASHIGRFHTTLTQYSVDDVEWVAGLVLDPFLIVVPADSPFQTFSDLVGYLKENPRELYVGSFGGEGSSSNIAWHMMEEAAGVKGTWVPFNSVGDAVTAVLGHHINAAIAYVGLVKDYVKTGQLRVLGIMTAERVSLLPEAPTFAEQGFDVDTNWAQFRGIIAPKGVPEPILQTLSDAILQAMKTETLQTYVTNANLIDASMGYEAFEQFVRRQDELTVEWIERLGIAQ